MAERDNENENKCAKEIMKMKLKRRCSPNNPPKIPEWTVAKVRKLNNTGEKDYVFENNTEAAVGGGNTLVALFAEQASGISSEVRREDEPIFNVMPPVKTFTGRTGELIELHWKLQKPRKPMLVSQCAVLSGLGGVGKSELARKYAWEYHNLYKHIIWINCEKKLDTLKSFKKLAEDLEILEKSPDKRTNVKKLEKDLQSILPKINKRISKFKTLLIFDNADHFEDIKNFLPFDLTPADEKPAIIITSRNSDWDIGEEGDIAVILLNQFTPHEATKFVKKSLQIKAEDKSCDTLISELIEILCYFPLALHDAVSCIRTKGSLRKAIQEYLKEFCDEERKGNLLKTKPKHDRYTETTYTTWLVTFENIRKNERNGKQATQLVEIMAYLAPGHISFWWESDEFSEYKNNKEAIDILVKYSIIRVRNNEANILRLVQLAVRLWLKDQKKEEEVLGLILNRVYKNLDETHIAALLSYVCDYTTLMDEYLHITLKNRYLLCFETPFNYHVESGNVCTVRKILDYLELKRDLWHGLYRSIFHADGVYCHPKDHEYDNSEDGRTEEVENEKHIKYVYLFHTEVNQALKTSKTEDLEEFLQSFDKSLINSRCNDEMALHKSVKIGNLDVVKVLLKYGADINYGNNDYDCPLNVALQAKHPEVAEYLLEQAADPNPRSHGQTKPIHYAAMLGYVNVVQCLADRKEEFENRSPGDWTPLHFAAQHDQLETVKCLINIGVDARALTKDGKTACEIAVANGSIRVLKYLIDNKLVDVNLRNKNNETFLYTAASHGQLSIVQYLLNATPFANDNIGIVRSLVHAAAKDQLEIVKFLISKRVDVKAMTEDGETACHIAVASGSIRVVKYLIDNKLVDVNLRNKNNETLFSTAALHGQLDIVQYLLSATSFAHDNIEIVRSLFHAAAKDQLEIVKFLISKGADVTTRIGDGQTASHIAVASGSIRVVKYLIDNKLVDVNLRNKNNETFLNTAALHGQLDIVQYLLSATSFANDNIEIVRSLVHAAAKDQLEIVKFLISKGADVTAMTRDGKTACHIAVEKGNIRIVKYLIDNKLVDVNLRNKNNETFLNTAALHGQLDIVQYLLSATSFAHDNIEISRSLVYAAAKDRLEIVKFLISKGADVTTRIGDGQTASHIAVASGSIRVVKYLIDNKLVDVNLRNKNNETLLRTADLHGQLSIVQYLLNAIPFVNDNIEIVRSLFHAAAKDQLEIVKFLISKGADVTTRIGDGQTASHIAVASGSIRVVKYLIDNKLVDVNLRNKNNETLLSTAAKHNNFGILKYLINDVTHVKVDINAFDDWGVTSLLHAVANGNAGIVRYLTQHGAKVDNVQNEATLLGKLKLSALHVAAFLGRLDIVKTLVEESNADINMGLDTSASPLLVANTFNSSGVRNFLHEKGADESSKDNSENVRRIFLSVIGNKDADDYIRDIKNLTIKLLKCGPRRRKNPQNKTLELDRYQIIQSVFNKLLRKAGLFM